MRLASVAAMAEATKEEGTGNYSAREREWTLKDRPFALGQPDLFLGSDPVAP
jgi:hypothetical protein